MDSDQVKKSDKKNSKNPSAAAINLDHRTLKVIKSINSQSILKNAVVISCFGLIFAFLIATAYPVFKKSEAVKFVLKKKDEIQNLRKGATLEKTMLNPRIKFQYGDQDVYTIKASKATHVDNKEVFLTDVFAIGDVGDIKSKHLQISENGEKMIFSGDPVININLTKIKNDKQIR